ncbi:MULTISPECIES: Dabb family protein [Paraburkholderia]|uniref:Dabb family protein n=1 Tax=Paraburkholderia metrosideri TaxID=580937 RepID=A0ABW9E479_9BURK
MIRHILLFSFRDTAHRNARTALLEMLAGFPARFPKMQKFQIGANVSDRDRTFEYAMTVEFEERTDLDDYLRSEYHEQFVAERFRPLISQRAIATIEVRS